MPDPSSTKRTDKLRQSLLFEEGLTPAWPLGWHPKKRQRRSPPHVSTRFIAPSETFVHWLNAIRVILLNFAFMIFKIGMAC